jgi:hypothetical protein
MCVTLYLVFLALWIPNTDIWPVRSAPAVLGYGAALSVVLAAFTFTGGKLTGYERDPEVDEVSRKEFLRKNRRRPIDQIVNELGEGRGMHWISRDVAFELGSALLTHTQASPLPVMRSAGHSASRPTTALTCRSLLPRRYVSYTQQYYSPCSSILTLPQCSSCNGSRPAWEYVFPSRLRLLHAFKPATTYRR